MDKQKGISLLEIILALAIVAVISMVTIRYFVTVNRDQKIEHAISQIQRLSKASYEWLQVQRQADFRGNGNPISLTKLSDTGLITVADSVGPWGGAIRVEPSVDPSYVDIIFPNVPIKVCQNLRTRMQGVAHRQTIAMGCTLDSYFIEL